MRRRVPLPADSTASGVARRAVRAELPSGADADAARAESVDDAELVASELVSNAVSHGRPPFELHLDATPGRIRMTVTNHGAQGDPHVEHASNSDGRGRGLAMVDTLSEDWGWQRDGDVISVWAVVRVP